MLEAPLSVSDGAPAGTDGFRGSSGGKFEFDDGGAYCGGWVDGKAHGYGVCTGPRGQGEFAGEWTHGYETTGVYTWPNGNTFSGEWADGRRNGLGRETHGRWIYHGEWTAGIKGRYGVRHSTVSGARYEGTWVGGLQDGFGVETYSDNSTYYGQWVSGLRHGFGVRQSAPFSVATPVRHDDQRLRNMGAAGRRPHHHNSMPALNSSLPLSPVDVSTTQQPVEKWVADYGRSGFVLVGDSGRDATSARRHPRSRSSSLRRTVADTFSSIVRKRKPDAKTDDRPTFAQMSRSMSSGADFVGNRSTVRDDVIETYMGAWRADKRCGYGISQRTDGFSYAGEWYNDKRSGYGSTSYPDDRPDQLGKYKDNELIADVKKDSRRVFMLRLSKLKDRANYALVQAQKAAETAAFKADVAAARRVHAREKAEQAAAAAQKAIESAQLARAISEHFSRSPTATSLTSNSHLDVTQITSRTTSSPQSTSTRHTVNNSQPTSASRRQTVGHSQRPSSDDQNSQRLQSRTQPASTSKNAAVAVASGVAPGNGDVVERIRRSSSTSAASASTTGRGPPLPSSATPTAPSRPMHQRRSRQHSIERQVPDDAAAPPRRPSTTNDVSGSQTVVSGDGLTLPAPPATNRDDAVVVPRRSNASAALAAVKPVTGNVYGQAPSARDVTAPPRHRYTARKLQSFHSDPLDVTSSANKQNSQTSTSPSVAAPLCQKSLDNTGSSKHGGGESVDADERLNTAPVARRLRRRRRQASPSPTGGVRDGDRKRSGSEEGDPSASRRLTMPSVVHYDTPHPPTPPAPRHNQLSVRPPSDRPASAVYVLSDGVRRRLVPTDAGSPSRSQFPDIQPSTELAELAEPPQRYSLEPAGPSRPGGSMVNMVGGGQRPAVWRREDVSIVSEQRREEIRRQKERDHQETYVLRLDDIKGWCESHEMLLLVLTLNLTLAAVFYRLLIADRSPPV